MLENLYSITPEIRRDFEVFLEKADPCLQALEKTGCDLIYIFNVLFLICYDERALKNITPNFIEIMESELASIDDEAVSLTISKYSGRRIKKIALQDAPDCVKDIERQLETNPVYIKKPASSVRGRVKVVCDVELVCDQGRYRIQYKVTDPIREKKGKGPTPALTSNIALYLLFKHFKEKGVKYPPKRLWEIVSIFSKKHFKGRDDLSEEQIKQREEGIRNRIFKIKRNEKAKRLCEEFAKDLSDENFYTIESRS